MRPGCPLLLACILLWIGISVTPACAGRPIRQLYEAECAACHGSRGDGKGPAAPFLLPRPRDFTSRRFKLRTTPTGSMPTREDVAAVLERGMPTRGMASFDFLPRDERQALVDEVFRLAGSTAPPASPVPVEPHPSVPPDEMAARGEQIYNRMQCYKCHEPRPATADPIPPLTDDRGFLMKFVDLELDEWTTPDTPREQYIRLATGMDGTPMPSFKDSLSGEDKWAIADYLKKIHRPRPNVRRFRDPRPQGQLLMERYKCNACHFAEGKGGDVGPSLELSGRRLQASWIRQWLEDPRARGKIQNLKPYMMPDLKLAPWEVEVLVGYVLHLGNRKVDDPVLPIPPATPASIERGRKVYEAMCPRCHGLGTIMPASVPSPTGQDLIRVAQRNDYGWLLGSIVSEGVDQLRAYNVRDFLWTVSSAARPGPGPFALPPRGTGAKPPAQGSSNTPAAGASSTTSR